MFASSSVILTLLVTIINILSTEATTVKDVTESNIHFYAARRSSDPSGMSINEFELSDIIFLKGKPTSMETIVQRCLRAKPTIRVVGTPANGAFSLTDGEHKMNVQDIGAALGVKNCKFLRPTRMVLNEQTFTISEAVTTYASDIESIEIHYRQNDEQIYYQKQRVTATKIISVILDQKQYTYDFMQFKVNNINQDAQSMLYVMAYVPNVQIIYDGNTMSMKDFLAQHPRGEFHGKYQLVFQGVVDPLIYVFQQCLKYTITDYLTLPTGMVHPYHVLNSLKHLPELRAWRPRPNAAILPLETFINDVYPDEDPKQNRIQVFENERLLSIDEIIALLNEKGRLIFGDMSYAQKLPTDDDRFVIWHKNQSYTVPAFLNLFGNTQEYYQVAFDNNWLTVLELEKLVENMPKPRPTPPPPMPPKFVVKFNVTFSVYEIMLNLAEQSPRHCKIIYQGTSYSPQDFLARFQGQDHMPEDFTIESNDIPIHIEDVFQIIDINQTPQFIKMYQIMTIDHQDEEYTKDDVLKVILLKPDGWMIVENGHYLTPQTYNEHFGDNVPPYVLYYKDRPVSPGDLHNHVNLEQILDNPFPTITFDGDEYTPKEIVAMLDNQQPEKVFITYKGQEYSTEDYRRQFPSVRFKIRYLEHDNIFPEDLEQIIIFDMKHSWPNLKFNNVKHNGKTYNRMQVIDILIKEDLPTVRILFEGIFYSPKQFKRFFTKLPTHFAVVQNQCIIPSHLLPTIVHFDGSKLQVCTYMEVRAGVF